MNRYHITLLLAVLAVAGMAIVPGAIAVDSDEEDEPAPGEHLTGAIGAQSAELDAEVDERAFGQAIANAAAEGDSEALAALITERTEHNEAQLDELADRIETIETAYAEGELSTAEYRHAIAQLEVERQSIERTSGEAATAALGMPAEELEAHGINVTAIETLQANASELGGEAVSELARQIAGPNVGNASPDRPSMADRMIGQIEGQDATVAIERAAHWVDHAERTADRLHDRAEWFDDADRGPFDEVDQAVWDELEAASAAIDSAHSALDEAEAALADGDEAAAIEHAQTAASHAAEANEHAAAAAGELHIGGGDIGPGPPIGGGPPGD